MSAIKNNVKKNKLVLYENNNWIRHQFLSHKHSSACICNFVLHNCDFAINSPTITILRPGTVGAFFREAVGKKKKSVHHNHCIPFLLQVRQPPPIKLTSWVCLMGRQTLLWIWVCDKQVHPSNQKTFLLPCTHKYVKKILPLSCESYSVHSLLKTH